jgi:hypothetical protein
MERNITNNISITQKKLRLGLMKENLKKDLVILATFKNTVYYKGITGEVKKKLLKLQMYL